MSHYSEVVTEVPTFLPMFFLGNEAHQDQSLEIKFDC